MKFANLAYQNTLPPLDQLHDNHIIDLLCTPIQTVDLDNFPNLKRFRASRSRRLVSVTIKNCPNLEVIELSYCRSLSSIHLENLPNLQALSLRLTKVSSLVFSLPSLKYLDISCTQIGNQLPDAPNLLAFDNSQCNFDDFDLLPIANKYPRLQRLRSLAYVDRPIHNSYGLKHRIRLNLNKLSEHPCLEHVLCGPASITCDSISPNTHLNMICLEYPQFDQGTEEQLLSTFPAVVIGATPESYNKYTVSKYPDYHPMEWEQAALLILGPWGIPETDFKPKITPAHESKPYSYLLNELKPSEMSIEEVSTKYDMNIAVDHMMGSIFGSAIGDSLGMPTEFTNTAYAHFALDVPLSYLWNILPSWDRSNSFFQATVTDDTEQAVMIMRTLADCNGELNLFHFGQLLGTWASKGISEHGQHCALDVGATTFSAICSSNFSDDPLGSALRKNFACGNGGTMRTAPVGCFKFWDLNTVIKNALNFSCVTHYNDICAVSVLAISLLIAKNIQRSAAKDRSNYTEEKMTSEEIDATIDEAFDIVAKEFSSNFDVQANKTEMMTYLKAKDFETLRLSGRQTGYVLRAAGAAILTLRKGMNFVEAMTEIIRWAGDADSNAAVVGGVIGAVVGFSGIPTDISKYLFTGHWQYVEFERMCDVMGIKAPRSPFLDLSYQ